MGKMGDRMRADMAKVKADKDARAAERKAKHDDRLADARAHRDDVKAAGAARVQAAKDRHEQVKADRAEVHAELAKDREGRTLGGFGRRRKTD